MHRRTFLQSAIALPALLGSHSQVATGRRVVIVGAGLAGLAAAHELERAGYDVVVLEARTRPGGRVYTMREPFSDGLYAEAGAARIQDTHVFTLRYIKQFNLTLDPFWPTEGASAVCIGPKRLTGPPRFLPDLANVPGEFTAEERKLGHGGSLVKYLFSHLGELGDVTAPDWPSKDLSRFEKPIADFCLEQGASPAFVRLIAFGHDLGSMSTLHLLREAGVGASTKDWFKIRGGNDLLPKAMAAALAQKIHYGTPVVRIEQDTAGVRVTALRGETPFTVAGDYLVCAIPLPVLRRIEIAPAWSGAKRAAIEQVESMAMARVFLQARTRFWLDRGESGWGGTDDPIDVWDYTRGQPGTRGILGAYTSGRMARQITAMDPGMRGAFVLDRMERLHPGMRTHYEGSASYSWTADPWALGAAAEFKPGQMTSFARAIRTAEGRVHFAGEHTSPWSGWMNGGLESGHRAAAEILARRG